MEAETETVKQLLAQIEELRANERPSRALTKEQESDLVRSQLAVFRNAEQELRLILRINDPDTNPIAVVRELQRKLEEYGNLKWRYDSSVEQNQRLSEEALATAALLRPVAKRTEHPKETIERLIAATKESDDKANAVVTELRSQIATLRERVKSLSSAKQVRLEQALLQDRKLVTVRRLVERMKADHAAGLDLGLFQQQLSAALRMCKAFRTTAACALALEEAEGEP